MQTAYAPTTAHDAAEHILRWERLTLGSGAIAAGIYLAGAAIFIGTIVPHLPAMGAPAAQQAAFYAQQSQNLLYRLVSYFGQAQMAFLILFFGGLFGLLRRAERGSGALAAAVFVAGSAIAGITPLAIMFEDHLLLGLAAAGADRVLVCAFGDLAAWLYISWAFGPYVALTAIFLPLLFPDGRLPSARWRRNLLEAV
jgi:hypothetical protein